MRLKLRGPKAIKLTHDRQILLLTLLSGFPAVVTALVFIWAWHVALVIQCALTLLVVGFWITLALFVRVRLVRPLQTLSNLVLALREEDFSIRARTFRLNDPLDAVFFELNALSDTLREQRLGALEATALLRTVMEEISIAVLTFDEEQRLRLVNRAGERLLARASERLLGHTASELGLSDCLEGEAVRTLQKTFPSGMGRWEMRRSSFRQHGRPHQLLVLADLSQALREEERLAWQRLLRVLGHELNNSLAPIKSLSSSLAQLLARPHLPDDWQDDMKQGLAVISGRAAALGRFMQDYSRLARLPQPKLRPIQITPLIHRVVGLETRLKVTIVPGPDATLQADPDQLEQLLINLVRNAVDAALETKGNVQMSWLKSGNCLEILTEDEGPGLPNTANLFVPFFTTKPGGSGIGLALGRQIAEAHGGSLVLENKVKAPGCIARLRLPFP